MTPETYARAVELDDDLPLDVCPGCGQDLTPMRSGEDHMTPSQWADHVTKYGTGLRPDGTVMFVSGNHIATSPFVAGKCATALRCAWTSDFLAARWFRRVWRLEYEAAHA